MTFMTYKEIWINEFGNKNVARDFAGREIHLCDHGDSSSEYGWDVDHIMPESNGGSNNLSNLQIVNIQTNREKANKTSFCANGRYYQVKREAAFYDSVANYDYRNKSYVIVRS